MTTRAGFGAALVGYVSFVAFILGESDGSRATGVVAACAELLSNAGVPDALTIGSRVEFVLNAAMFVPIAFLATLTFPRHHWANWVVYGFVGSAAAELVQALWLPLRSAQYVDIVANTLGMLAGAVAGWLVVSLTRTTGVALRNAPVDTPPT